MRPGNNNMEIEREIKLEQFKALKNFALSNRRNITDENIALVVPNDVIIEK